MRIKNRDDKSEKLRFPLVILVANMNERLSLQMNSSGVRVRFKDGEVYSETDFIE